MIVPDDLWSADLGLPSDLSYLLTALILLRNVTLVVGVVANCRGRDEDRHTRSVECGRDPLE